MKEKYPTQEMQIQALKDNFKEYLHDIRLKLHNSLDEKNYNVFSNTTSASNYKRDHVSLESPHNVVHVAVGRRFDKDGESGASGDMSWNETAGFDPIFHMHHSNVGNVIILYHYFDFL